MSNKQTLGRRPVLLLGVAVTVGFLVVFLTSAIKNVIPAYFVPMANFFDVSRAEFAIGPTVFMVVYGLMSPVIGAVADRFGARNTISGGLLLAGTSFLTAALVPNHAVFVVAYGIGAAIAFTAVSYIPVGILVDELFPPDRRGISYALLTNGTALGFIVLSPAWIALSQNTDWRLIFGALGLIYLVPLALANHFLLKSPAGSDSSPSAPDKRPPIPLRKRLDHVLRTPGFWVLSASFFGCGVTMGFIDVHIVAHMQETNSSAPVISGALIVLGVTEIIGAVVAGRLCDRFPGRYILAGAYLLRGLSLLVLVFVPGAIGSFAFAAVFGVSYMGTVIATTLYALDIFDVGSKGLALGLIWLTHQLGSAASSQGGGIAFTQLGSYLPAIVTAAVISFFSFSLVMLVAPRRASSTTGLDHEYL